MAELTPQQQRLIRLHKAKASLQNAIIVLESADPHALEHGIQSTLMNLEEGIDMLINTLH